jgi:hypothetical protein
MWAPAADQQALVRQGEEVRFAADSPVEEDGFEPSVPACVTLPPCRRVASATHALRGTRRTEFAADSPLEGGGFEPSVPRRRPSPPWPLNLLQP